MLPGKKYHSTQYSTQLATAANLYSRLWLSRKDSRDNVLGFDIAVTKYSDQWKKLSIVIYQPKLVNVLLDRLTKMPSPKVRPSAPARTETCKIQVKTQVLFFHTFFIVEMHVFLLMTLPTWHIQYASEFLHQWHLSENKCYNPDLVNTTYLSTTELNRTKKFTLNTVHL